MCGYMKGDGRCLGEGGEVDAANAEVTVGLNAKTLECKRAMAIGSREKS